MGTMALEYIFFRDAAEIINKKELNDIIVADDLNIFNYFDRDLTDIYINGQLRNLQQELHRWCYANQISFDAGKESFHTLSRLYL